MQDFVAYIAMHLISTSLSYHHLFSLAPMAFLTTISSVHEPQNLQEANSQDIWKRVMNDKLQALAQNQTWSIVILPRGKQIVSNRWGYIK